jgi:hypothetical protein
MSDDNGEPDSPTNYYGYVPISQNDTPRIAFATEINNTTLRRERVVNSTRTSLRREVFFRLGKIKSEKLYFHRIYYERDAQMKTLHNELENIGTLVFNDLEEERIALGQLHNMLLEHTEVIARKYADLEQEQFDLELLWRCYLTRGFGGPIPQYNLD